MRSLDSKRTHPDDAPEVRLPRFLEVVPPRSDPAPAHFPREREAGGHAASTASFGDATQSDPVNDVDTNSIDASEAVGGAGGLQREGHAPKIPLPGRWPSAGHRERTAGAPPPAPAGDSPEVEAPRATGASTSPPSTRDAASVAALAAAIDRLRIESERLAEQARADALEIGFQVARRILEIELSTSPEPLFALVRSAVRRAGTSRTLKVRLHPIDLATMEAGGGATRVDALAAARIQLVGDSLLERGDCMIEADFGTVDGRLDTRLEELKRAVSSTVDGAPT